MTQTELTNVVERHKVDANNKSRSEMAKLGQFLTPQNVAALVASTFRPLVPSAVHLRLLDPGAGIGSLSAAFVNWMLNQRHRPRSLEIIAVELDASLIPLLRRTLKHCERLAEEHGISLRSEIHQADFLEISADQDSLFSGALFSDFTHVIMNPPYRKIASDSKERLLLRKQGIEISNIYAGFVELGARFLKEKGELAAITPRSFCNGTYFREFRKHFFSTMRIQAAHLFVSRKEAFSQDAVLQENIIYSVQKSSRNTHRTVAISSSNGPSDKTCVLLRVPYFTVLRPNDKDSVLHLPVDGEGLAAMELMAQLPATLEDLGVKVSTGPVVDFRSRRHLRKAPGNKCVPLLYPTHFSRDGIEWPKECRKPNAILEDELSTRLLVPMGDFVLVKRFSSKEEKKRIVARVLEAKAFPFKHIGLENHLNFFHRDGKSLDLDFSFGLAAYLNSTVVDAYFRQFNGHTQVNATDLRMMRYPNERSLQELGRSIQDQRGSAYEQPRIDRLISALMQ
jgi:adenine-specific DNA-methyltransferase